MFRSAQYRPRAPCIQTKRNNKRGHIFPWAPCGEWVSIAREKLSFVIIVQDRRIKSHAYIKYAYKMCAAYRYRPWAFALALPPLVLDCVRPETGRASVLGHASRIT